jgi:hypothetical protein
MTTTDRVITYQVMILVLGLCAGLGIAHRTQDGWWPGIGFLLVALLTLAYAIRGTRRLARASTND